MERAPTLISIKPIAKVSYSQWLALRSCPLKALLASSSLQGRLPLPPPTRASVIGHFHHRAMEFVASSASSAELDAKLEDEIKKVQAKISGWPHLARLGSVSGWDEINQSASLARELLASKNSFGGVTANRHAETELHSASGLLVGRPDMFSIAGSRAFLREYKSTGIREIDGAVKGAYVDQVRFYACLVFDSFAVDAVDASIESLSGDRFELSIEPADAAEFGESVASLVREVNRRVDCSPRMEELALPSADSCAFCAGRVLCLPFKRAQDDLGLDGEQFVIEGIVVHLEETTRGARATVADIHRGMQIDLILPSYLSEEIKQGAAYTFINLRRQGTALSWGHTSQVLASA